MNSTGGTLPPYPALCWWQFPAISLCRAKVRSPVLHSNKDLSCSAFPPWKVCPLNGSIARHCCPTAALATADLKNRKTAAWLFVHLKTICYTDFERLLANVAFLMPSNAWLSLVTARYFVSCVSKVACKHANVTLYGSAHLYFIVKEVTEDFRMSATKESETLAVLQLF